MTHPLTYNLSLDDVDELEDQEDLRLVMERRNGPTTRLTLEELSMLPQEDN